MSNAFLGQGSLLQLFDANAANPVTIVEIKSINGPDEKVAIVDVTSHSSPNHRREFITGLVDPGSLKFTGVWVPNAASQNGSTGFYSVFSSGAIRQYQLILSNQAATTLVFSGFAVSSAKQVPIDKEASFDGEIKITGVITGQ